MLPLPGPGLTVRVHQGEALAGATFRTWTAYDDVPVPDDAVSWVWQMASGLYEVTADATPPSAAALSIARATTATGSVVDVEDLRPISGSRQLLRTRVVPAPGVVDDWLAPSVLHIERITLRLSSTAQSLGATAGVTRLDLLNAGVSLWPSSATEDLRPSIAFDAPDLIVTAYPEVCLVDAGTVLTASLEVPVGATSEHAEIILWGAEV